MGTYSFENPFAPAGDYSDDNPFHPARAGILKKLKVPVAPAEATQVGQGPAVAKPGHFPEPIRSIGQFLVDPALEHPLTTMAVGAASPLIAAGMEAAGISAPVIGATMAAPMLTRPAEYAGQKAAELSLPPDQRAIAEADPSRVSGREAATMTAAAAVPPLIGAAYRAFKNRPPPATPPPPAGVARQLTSGNRPATASARIVDEAPAAAPGPTTPSTVDAEIVPSGNDATALPEAPAAQRLLPRKKYSAENPYWDHDLERELPADGPARSANGALHIDKASDTELAKEYAELIEARAHHAGIVSSFEEHPAFAEAAEIGAKKPGQKRDTGTSLRTGSGRFVPTSEDDYGGLSEDAAGALARGGLPLDAFKQHAQATAAADKADKQVTRIEAELTRRGIDHADAYWMAQGTPAGVEGKRTKYSAGEELALFGGENLFGQPATMAESDVGAGGKARPAHEIEKAAAEAKGAAPISAEEMAARRDELGAPKSEAEQTAKATPEQRSMFEAKRAQYRVSAPVTAYHGTPHDFDKFKLQHIGSGEGAQSYGWGLYFAGEKSVAEYYRRSLSDYSSHATFAVDGKQLDPNSPEKHGASLLAFNNAREIRATAKRWVEEAKMGDLGMADTAKHSGLSTEEYWQRLSDFVQSHRKADIKVSRGRLYTAKLPDDHDMLDWDKPLSEQSDKVRQALAPLQEEYRKTEGRSGPYISPDATGQQIYNEIGSQLQDMGRTLDPKMGAAEAASKHLASLGIAGIKYADAASRSPNVIQSKLHDLVQKHGGSVEAAVDELGKSVYLPPKEKAKWRDGMIRGYKPPTSNYVVFDDRHIDIQRVEAKGGTYAKPSRQQLDLFKQPETLKKERDLAFGPSIPTVESRLANIPNPPETWEKLTGRTLSHVDELHGMLFPYRDPLEERLHVILTKEIPGDPLGRSTVVSHTMDSSGMLDFVQLDVEGGWLQAIADRAKETGADSVILSHGHPAGDATQSEMDEGFTASIGYKLWNRHALKLRGHYVIDHNTGTWLEAWTPQHTVSRGNFGIAAIPFTNMATPPGAVDWTNPGSPLMGGRTEPGADRVAFRDYVHGLVRAAEPDGNGLMVVYIDSQTKPVAVEPLPLEALDRLHAHVGPMAKRLGADRALLVAPDGSEEAVMRSLATNDYTIQIPDVAYYSQGPNGPVIRTDPATSANNSNRQPRRVPVGDKKYDAKRVFAPRKEYGEGGGGEPPRNGTAAQSGGLVPKGRGVVPAVQTALRRAADFYAAAFHDPYAPARRLDPAYAELADKALAAKPFAGHFARTMAHWTDEHLTPAEAETLSRVQIIGRLEDINDREDQGQLSFVPQDVGERAQRDATIARYTDMVPEGFLNDKRIQDALRRRMQVYRDALEPAAIEGNVSPASFSASPTGHIKLIPIRPKGEPSAATAEVETPGTKTAQAAKTAKGTAIDYVTDWETVLGSDARDKFQAAATNRWLRGTAERGRDLEPGEQLDDDEMRLSFRDPANVIADHGPRIHVAIKKPLGQAFGHVDKALAPKGAPTNDVAAVARVVDNVAGQVMFTMNPAALISHARNMANALGSAPEAGPLGWLKAAAGLVPGGKLFRGLGEIAALDMRAPEARAIRMRLAEVGGLRPVELAYGGLGEAFAKAKKDFLKRAGDKLPPPVRQQLEKLSVFGENGIDERVRVGLAMKYLAQKSDASDSELGQYVNRLAANYTRGLGGVVVDAFQHAKLSMFMRIETAKLGLGARTMLGRSLLPSGSPAEAAELWVKQLMLSAWGAKLGTAAVIAAASMLLARKLVQAPGKENDIPTGQQDAQGRDIYISGRFLSPSDAVTQDLGMDAAARGDVKGARQALTNTALRLTTSHPIARLGFAGVFNATPNVDREGKLRPIGTTTLSGTPRLKTMAKAATDITAFSPFTREQPVNATDSPAGKAAAYAGMNVRSTARAPALVTQGLARQDVSAWLDDMTKTIGQASTPAARAQALKDALEEMQRAGAKDPALADALLRSRAIAKLQRAAGRAAARGGSSQYSPDNPFAGKP